MVNKTQTIIDVVVFQRIFLQINNIHRKQMNKLTSIKNILSCWTKPFFLQNTKIEVHQERDNVSKVIYKDTHFFTSILFLTSISPCET